MHNSNSEELLDILWTPYFFLSVFIYVLGLIIVHFIFGINSINGEIALLLLVPLTVIVASAEIIKSILRGVKLESNERIAMVIFSFIIVAAVTFAVVLYCVRIH